MTSQATALSRTEFIESLVRIGFARDRANAEASRRYPPIEPNPQQLLIRESSLERIEQNDIRKLVIAIGGTVKSTSSIKKAKIAIGFPDLRVHIPDFRIALWWETKTKDGKISDEQGEFLRDEWTCGAFTGAGTFYDFHQYLLMMPQIALTPYRIGLVSHAMQLANLSLNPDLSMRDRLPAFLITPGLT